MCNLVIHVIDDASEPEIGDLSDSILDEDVGWLDITMNHVVLLKHFESLTDIPQKAHSFGLR